jgi:hypothetical protein
MSITLGDKDVDVFKLYDEMAVACSKDIEGYKAMIGTIEVMIAQKIKELQDIKDKTIERIKTSLETTPSRKASVQKKKAEKINYAEIAVKESIPGKIIASGQADVATIPSVAAKEKSKAKIQAVKAQSSVAARQKKKSEKGKAKKADKPKKPVPQTKKTAVKSMDAPLEASLKKTAKAKPARDISALKCLYHPESPVLDKARQLCSSCKWKLITNGLKQYYKKPAVIAFLKGESTTIPDLGQPMCPIHPAVPSYNQKTGLCKSCQKKAKKIGITERHLTEVELNVLRSPLA